MKKFVEKEAGTLLVRTMELLNECKLSMIKIHVMTDLPYHWLQQLSTNKTTDPSVNRIQYLYEFLTEQAIDV